MAGTFSLSEPTIDPLYGPQNCRTEQRALSAPKEPEILFQPYGRGNFFVRPYVSVLKILRILWRIQNWLKSTKKVM